VQLSFRQILICQVGLNFVSYRHVSLRATDDVFAPQDMDMLL